MELKTNTVKYQRLAVRQICIREESTDGIVPDSQPDIARIIDVSAMVFVRDRELGQDSVNMRCSAKVDVLYTTDEDKNIYHMEIPLSFSHRAELRGAAAGDNILTKSWIQSCDARMINTRKVSVRINAAFENTLYKITSETIVEGVADEFGWCKKTKDLEFSRVKAVSFKNFTLAEDVPLADDEPSVKFIAAADIAIRPGNIKLSENRVMVQADAVLTGLCVAEDGTVYRVVKPFTFNQSCDVPGIEESDNCKIDFELRSFEVIPAVDVSGTGRYLSMNVGVCMNVEACDKMNVTVLEDMYSLHNHCAFEKKELIYRQYNENNAISIKCEAKADNSDAANVISARYIPDRNIERPAEDGSIAINGTIQYIYENIDGEFCCTQFRTCDKALCGDDFVRIYLNADAITWQFRDGAIRFLYNVDLVTVNDAPVSTEYISQVTEGELYKPDRYSGLSAILRRSAEGENLWDIARAYRTTVAAIAAANAIDEDSELVSDKLLLIPIERV